MFRQRTSLQKPGDELLANFRQQFPEVAAATSSVSAPPAGTAAVENQTISAPSQEMSHSLSHEAFQDQDPTPRASDEPWRFTPSLLDPNSSYFASFANAPPGYDTNTIYHPPAGDLHAPTLSLSMGLWTPLSMPTFEGALHSGTTMMDLAGDHTLQPYQFYHFNPSSQAPQPQKSFAPSAFVHQDIGYETINQDGSPIDPDPLEERTTFTGTAFWGTPQMVGFQAPHFGGMQMNIPLPVIGEKFRFYSTLNAPTAMIKHADEIPVTYLNKGQTCSLSIVDTNATIPIAPGTKYRTYVRISFEDEQQRQKPDVCWNLWKEGRGTNEARQRGGRLRAVEYVEAREPSDDDDKRTRIELKSSSFDGFSVIWTPGIRSAAECSVAVRFNFLSTDFSHSKGVKGIPVRLCVKTSPYSTDPSQPAADARAEICFCKVKIFRDHGAERKLSNDITHVKKTIDKLRQQIAQAESAMNDLSKRKRASAPRGKGDAHRSGKVQKHKRTCSMSFASYTGRGGGRLPIEEALHFELQTLQDMFACTRPVSILYLRGEELDDPDLHPVSLPGDSADVAKSESRDSTIWQARSGRSSVGGPSPVSPSPSSLSLASRASAIWQTNQGSDNPTKVSKTDDAGNVSEWIEALGVDSSYRPPPEKATKPVACFYVLRQPPTEPRKREHYKAIYLLQRTLGELNNRIAAKWEINAAKILRTVHVLQYGLEVEMDDDVIQELKEGQDITIEVVEIGQGTSPAEREWEVAPQAGYKLRLTF